MSIIKEYHKIKIARFTLLVLFRYPLSLEPIKIEMQFILLISLINGRKIDNAHEIILKCKV